VAYVIGPELGDPRLSGCHVRRVAYSAADITRRVGELGSEITATYAGRELLVLALLKGSFIFVGDLVRQIQLPLQVDFVVASSYGAGTVSSGEVRLLYDPAMELTGRDLLLVEDVIDSGRTLNRLLDLLESRRPRSIEVCALLHKRLSDGPSREARFVGFDAPNEFLVGYGLDHAENYRHLPFIVSLQ
jgi:hypoxanthine phosphoribosyltransferase